MMKVNTMRFGELECSEAEIIRFPKGLFGFPEEKQFFLMKDPEQAPFMWLQSLQTPHLAFVVLDPWVAKHDYEIELPVELKGDLAISAEDQVMVLGIVVVPDNIKNMTINLRAPLVINVEQRVGEQFIFAETDYDIRYPVLHG